MEVLLLRLEAPMMSFGGATIDGQGVTRDYPARSMIAGLLGNALGYLHYNTNELQALQSRLHVAVRRDRMGEMMVDYQTVDLGQPFMRDQVAWTTRRAVEKRLGGSASTGTHIRHRHYLVDAIYTVALRLDPANEDPGLSELEAALQRPARPLFIGRKACLPSSTLCLGRVEATDERAAIETAPRHVRSDSGPLTAWWDVELGLEGENVFEITDERDWLNQIHVGRRSIASGLISPPAAGARS